MKGIQFSCLYINPVVITVILQCFCASIADAVLKPNTEKELSDYLLVHKNYNRLLRPAKSLDKKVDVHFDLLLSQLIGVNEREQYMITKVWLPQTWIDHRLSWEPEDYDNIKKLQIPSSKIWLPDIVLYNNADGEYEASLQSNAIIRNNGTVFWMPPAIYKSVCNIQVSSFPFDEQNCTMVFRSWTYTREDIELHLQHDHATLDDFTESGEWDIKDTPGTKEQPAGEDAYQEIIYRLNIKRKPLFYIVNLIIPCVLITFLAILVFYTPSDCGEKMTLCISVLLALTVFLLLLSKMVPPTSLDVPLIGKYLMFTMVLVTLSIIMSVVVLNVHHRRASTHVMPVWVRRTFIEILPPILMMQRPVENLEHEKQANKNGIGRWAKLLNDAKFKTFVNDVSGSENFNKLQNNERESSELKNAMSCVEYVTQHLKIKDDDQKMSEDWKFVAMTLDRLLLYLFIAVFFAGTVGVFSSASKAEENAS